MKGEFGWCGEQNKQNTHLLLAAAARNHQYRSLGGGGMCLQLEERGPAEELHLPHIKTSRGEFRLSYDANQTDYSPSPPRCSSLRSISTGERKSGESPAVLGGQISPGTADAIPSNMLPVMEQCFPPRISSMDVYLRRANTPPPPPLSNPTKPSHFSSHFRSG